MRALHEPAPKRRGLAACRMTEPRFAGPLSPRLRTLFSNLLRQTIPEICGNRRHRLQDRAAMWTSGVGSYEYICTRRHRERGADTRLRVRFSGRLGGHVLPAHYSASISTPTPNLPRTWTPNFRFELPAVIADSGPSCRTAFLAQTRSGMRWLETASYLAIKDSGHLLGGRYDIHALVCSIT